jgi:hypothetical protein
MNEDRGFNEELEFYLNDLDEMKYELTSSDDEEVRRERRIEVRRKMVPFYSIDVPIYTTSFIITISYIKHFVFIERPSNLLKV